MGPLDSELLEELCKEMDEILCDILEGKKPARKRDKDGETCVKCQDFYEFAEPNQPDGTMICYACRNYG